MITSSTKVAVFGGGGSLGLRVLPLLRESGVITRCLIRGSADRLDASVRDCVDEVVVGDVLDPQCVDTMCKDVDVIISMLTPSPLIPSFVQLHVTNLDSILSTIKPVESLSSSSDDNYRPPRIIVVGGAGVMERSWSTRTAPQQNRMYSLCNQHTNTYKQYYEAELIDRSFVTDTLPGRFVKTILPIYNDFFVAHKLCLRLLIESGFQWTMICPGFLRDGSSHKNKPRAVRLWENNVNDERLGGLSATYEDVASLILDELKNGKYGGIGVSGKRVGIESSRNYYFSLFPSTLSVIGWQYQRWKSM